MSIDRDNDGLEGLDPGPRFGEVYPGTLPTYTPPPPKMPLEIIKAVVAVMGEVKRLAKEGNNTYQRYRYTSVDQFYEALGPLMSSHGLMDLAIELSMVVDIRDATDDRGVTKKSAWLMATYEFWLFHVSGASYGPIVRRIQVPASGAQSYASAQSYSEKYFLRNLFKVPTGDKDEVEDTKKEDLPPTVTLITSTQFGVLNELIKNTATEMAKFLEVYKIDGLADLPAAQFKPAEDFLLKKQARQKAALAKLKMEPQPPGEAPELGYDSRRDPPDGA